MQNRDNKNEKSPFLDDYKGVFKELQEEPIFSDDIEEIMPFPTDNSALISTLSKIGLFYTIFFLISSFGAYILADVVSQNLQHLLSVPWQRSVLVFLINDVPQYVIALPILLALLTTIQNQKKPESFPTLQMTPKLFFRDLSVGYLFMYIGNFVSILLVALMTVIKGDDISNALNSVVSSSPTWTLVIFVGLLPPVLEELVFRKLLYKKLIGFGELPYILTSGILFGLFHGNLYQILYAFLVGCFFALIYARTEKIIIPMIMHAIVNLISGVLVGKAGEIATFLPALLSVPILAFTVYGLVTAQKRENRIQFSRSEKTPQSVPKVMASSWGMWIYVLACVAFIVYNTIV